MIASVQRAIGRRRGFFIRWFDAAPHYQPWPLLNRLGLQVARALLADAAYRLRPVTRHAELTQAELALDTKGMAIVERFLAPEAFQEVAESFHAILESPAATIETDRRGTGVTWTTSRVDPGPAPTPAHAALQRHLIEDPRIRQLAEFVLRRRLPNPPTLSLQRLELPQGERDDRDVEGVMHADRHFCCVKMALTINDNTTETGPYTYCEGSHKLTWARLQHEYEYSIRQAEALRGRSNLVEPALLERGRNRVSDAAWRDMKLVERPAVAPANTLVVSNNIGFHKRGRLHPGHRREQVRILFYYAQRPWYGRLAYAAYRALSGGASGRASGRAAA